MIRQRDWSSSPGKHGTEAVQSKEVPLAEVGPRGLVEYGVKATLVSMSLVQGKIWDEVWLPGSEGEHRAKKSPEPGVCDPVLRYGAGR